MASPCKRKKTGRKVRPCEAMHCSEKEGHLFKWPSDPAVARQWTKWVNTKRLFTSPVATSRLCKSHFEDQCFINLGMVKQGIHQRFVKVLFIVLLLFWVYHNNNHYYIIINNNHYYIIIIFITTTTTINLYIIVKKYYDFI